jgi:four helix bundle protein
MTTFAHEKLDIYCAALKFLAVADRRAATLPRGRAYLAEQLRRAALSIVLNIAEGAGEFSRADKARFYRMARRSGTECAAIFDACRVLRLGDAADTEGGRVLLDRIVVMLTAMVRRLDLSGAGAGLDV